MSKRRRMTAAELLTELAADPACRDRERAKQAKRATREAEVRAAEAPLLRDLSDVGIHVASVDDLRRHHLPLTAPAVRILLSHLDRIDHANVLEMIIRTLAVPANRYDGRPLATLFDRTQSDAIRWATANTIALARPAGIEAWLRNTVASRATPAWGLQMLACAVARLLPEPEALALLEGLRERVPAHATAAIAELRAAERSRVQRSPLFRPR